MRVVMSAGASAVPLTPPRSSPASLLATLRALLLATLLALALAGCGGASDVEVIKKMIDEHIATIAP